MAGLRKEINQKHFSVGLHFLKNEEIKLSTVEPRYNKGPRDWQNMFVITRFVNLYRGSF